MADIITLDLPTTEDIPVERVCDAAKACEQVLIIGEMADGTFWYACSTGELGWVSRMLLRALRATQDMLVENEDE